MSIVNLVCNRIHTSLTPNIRYNLHYSSKILVVYILDLFFKSTCWPLPIHSVRNRQQSTASQRYRNITRQVELQPLHPDGHPYPDPFLREIPAAHIHPSRRTRARDIDSSGRRQDIPAETDHDGELGANDALPAYDNFGGPPKYFELDTLSRNRPPESRVTQRPDASWENININSSENDGVHTPVGTTPASHASQHDTSRPTPPYSENLNRSSNDRSLWLDQDMKPTTSKTSP